MQGANPCPQVIYGERIMTIKEFIELLKKYPKYYKLFDSSAENGMIAIKDEKGKRIKILWLSEILPEDTD